MSASKPGQITKEDVRVIIENYRRHGRDTTKLEELLESSDSYASKDLELSVDDIIADLRKNSPVSEGTCCVCRATGTLLSGVCETCFVAWATQVAGDKIARKNKNRQREKL